jgi:predicted acetyltransferase
MPEVPSGLDDSIPHMHVKLDFHRPAVEHRAAFAEWIADWKGDAYDPYRWIFARAWTDFDCYLALCKRMQTEGCPPELTVPLDAYWAFDGETMVGELYVFYEPMGGDNHIGYKVRPSARRTGVGSALLHYGLERLRERGISVAYLTCRDTNAASAALIERAGGTRLEDKRGPEGHMIRRYRVSTER